MQDISKAQENGGEVDGEQLKNTMVQLLQYQGYKNVKASASYCQSCSTHLLRWVGHKCYFYAGGRKVADLKHIDILS